MPYLVSEPCDVLEEALTQLYLRNVREKVIKEDEDSCINDE